jgi:PAS domain S-box-containing protein
MDRPRRELDIAPRLARRLFPLALVAWGVLSVGVPLVHYWDGSAALHRHAADYAASIALGLGELAGQAPAPWRLQLQGYRQVLRDRPPPEDLLTVRVLDDAGHPVGAYESEGARSADGWERHPPTGSAPIIVDNRAVGTVRVEVARGPLLGRALLVWLAATLAGTAVALILYHVPVGFVARLEAESRRVDVQSSEAALLAAAEWRQTFDALDTPVVVSDPDGRIMRANRAVSTLTGRDVRSLPGLALTDLGAGEPWRTAVALVGEARATRAGSSRQGRDEASGRSWDVSVSCGAGAGAPDGRSVVIARDITAIVDLEESARRSETMAAIGQLVAGVAHEVRNPLFNITAMLDAFEANMGQRPELAELGRVLRSEAERLNDLMRDLLEYGRPSAAVLHPGRIDAVIAVAVQSCASLAEAAHVAVTRDVAAGLAAVAMDERRLGQAFHNLLANAVQHAPPGSRVTVTAREASDAGQTWVECVVQDSGAGFSPEALDHMFTPFFTTRRGGTGLGLSIVQRVVTEHGGQLSASNQPEGGAAVTIRLPAVAGEAAAV